LNLRSSAPVATAIFLQMGVKRRKVANSHQDRGDRHQVSPSVAKLALTMGKKIYGQGNSNSSRKRAFLKGGKLDGDEDSNGWLILAPVRAGSTEEAARDAKVAAAFAEVLALSSDAESSSSSSMPIEGGLLAAYADAASQIRSADCFDDWVKIVSEILEDAGRPLEAADEIDDEGDEGEPRSADVVHALRRAGALIARAPPLPAPCEGDPVLAVLKEDGEWHAAVVAEAAASEGDGEGEDGRGGSLVVRFLQWGHLQRCERKSVVLLATVIDDDTDDTDDAGQGRNTGECELCERALPLTFHHLVPKQTHSKYLGRQRLPEGLPPDATPTKDFLSRYGCMLCAPCHAVVHRFAPNSTLAASYNSLDALRVAPAVRRWVEYAAARG
jgi:hypothetical protein